MINRIIIVLLVIYVGLCVASYFQGCATGPDSQVNVSLWKSNTGESNTNDSTSSTSASVPVSALK